MLKNYIAAKLRSVVVVSPDISIPDSSQSMVTKRISAQIVNKYFDLYS